MALTIVVITNRMLVMKRDLKDEIGKSTPFQTLEEEAYVGLQWTARKLSEQVEAVLSEADLSPTQYNVLRILRGAGKAGAMCREISERMITRDTDVTRLLDRLESRGLVARRRDETDRRVVRAIITASGKKVLAKLDEPVDEMNRRMLGHLGRRQLRELIELLEAARKSPESDTGQT